jgi:hypothetical protein
LPGEPIDGITTTAKELQMSVSNVGSGNTAALQNHLKTDQKTLAEDKAKKASEQTLTADQSKVTADQRAIAKAATGHAQPATGRPEAAEKSSGTDSPATTEAETTRSNPSTNKGLDISV